MAIASSFLHEVLCRISPKIAAWLKMLMGHSHFLTFSSAQTRLDSTRLVRLENPNPCFISPLQCPMTEKLRSDHHDASHSSCCCSYPPSFWLHSRLATSPTLHYTCSHLETVFCIVVFFKKHSNCCFSSLAFSPRLSSTFST